MGKTQENYFEIRLCHKISVRMSKKNVQARM